MIVTLALYGDRAPAPVFARQLRQRHLTGSVSTSAV
jgi:hypothetical protein